VLQLVNMTPFAAERAVLYDTDGGHVWVVVVKATYDMCPDGTLALARSQEPVQTHAEYFGEAGHSTLKREGEIVFAHVGTEIVVNGSAHARHGEPVRVVDVALEVGCVRKVVRVFGERRWESGLLGLRMTEPEPFIQWPLRYEFAYGGVSLQTGDVFAANPIGTGFFTDRSEAGDGMLPNLEDPAQLIRQWADRPDPAGLNAVPSHWPQRARFAGTADDHWIASRAPLLPEDFDTAFFNAASSGLVAAVPLLGGERLTLVNLTPAGCATFRLPRVHFNVLTTIDGRKVRQHTQLDRVIVEPDDSRLVMVWRSALPCGRDARRVAVTYIDTKRDLRTGRFHGI
jgi:hypothetical protein